MVSALTGPRDLCGALEVDDAQPLADVPVVEGFEFKLAGRAPKADLDVIVLVCAHRDAFVRYVGNAQEEVPGLLFERTQALVEALYLVRDSLHLVDEGGGVLLVSFQSGYLIGDRVAPGPEFFGLLEQPATLLFFGKEGVEGQGRAPVLEGLDDRVGISPDELYIEHVQNLRYKCCGYRI
jgi:hypothetical protein